MKLDSNKKWGSKMIKTENVKALKTPNKKYNLKNEYKPKIKIYKFTKDERKMFECSKNVETRQK